MKTRSTKHRRTCLLLVRRPQVALGRSPPFGAVSNLLRDRGRDAGFQAPPAQIRASAPNAHGSYLGYKRRTEPARRTPAAPGTRVPRTVSVACMTCRGSPRSAAFPPQPPPKVALLCSARFTGTTPQSDSSAACMSALRHCAFSDRPADCTGATEVSRFSCMLFLSVRSRLRLRGIPPALAMAHRRMWPSPHVHRVGIPERSFRSSIPGPPMPLSMLRLPPRDDRRKTRGQDGSLLLSCRALSSPTTCRFIPALGRPTRLPGFSWDFQTEVQWAWAQPRLRSTSSPCHCPQSARPGNGNRR